MTYRHKELSNHDVLWIDKGPQANTCPPHLKGRANSSGLLNLIWLFRVLNLGRTIHLGIPDCRRIHYHSEISTSFYQFWSAHLRRNLLHRMLQSEFFKVLRGLIACRGFSPADPPERYKDSEQLIRCGENKQNPTIYLPRRQQLGSGALRFPKLRDIVQRKAPAKRITELRSSICKHQNPDRSSQNCRTQESSPTEIGILLGSICVGGRKGRLCLAIGSPKLRGTRMPYLRVPVGVIPFDSASPFLTVHKDSGCTFTISPSVATSLASSTAKISGNLEEEQM
jgi:hypothetical protein